MSKVNWNTKKNSHDFVIERTEMSSRELHAAEYIASLDLRLYDGERHLEKRLRSVPDLWRQYRIARSAIEKVIDGLYDTMPLHTLAHFKAVSTNIEVILRPKSVLNNSTNSQVVLNKDIITLVNHCIESECSMCLKTKGEIKKCKLRKALMNIAPVTDVGFSSLCEYANEGKIQNE